MKSLCNPTGPARPARGPGIERAISKGSLRLLVGVRFQVLFHSPRRGAFHLSLTVLVRYRSVRST